MGKSLIFLSILFSNISLAQNLKNDTLYFIFDKWLYCNGQMYGGLHHKVDNDSMFITSYISEDTNVVIFEYINIINKRLKFEVFKKSLVTIDECPETTVIGWVIIFDNIYYDPRKTIRLENGKEMRVKPVQIKIIYE